MYGAGQEEAATRRIREVLAETVPEKAPEIYRKICTPGLTVDFTREAKQEDIISLKRGFHLVIHCYRVGRRIYAGFRHPSERDTVANQLKDASDHQGASATPLVVTNIDDRTVPKNQAADKTKFNFGKTPPKSEAKRL